MFLSYFLSENENGLGGRMIFSWFYVNRFSGVLAFHGEKHFFLSFAERGIRPSWQKHISMPSCMWACLRVMVFCDI